MKLIALDLDGTLLRRDKTLSERNLETLKLCQDAGLQVVVATARSPRSVKKILPEAFGHLTWICYNGAEIYQGDNRIYEDLIPVVSARQAAEIVESLFPESTVIVEISGKMFANRAFKYSWEYEVADLQESITGGVAKILFTIEDPAPLKALEERLPEGCRLLVTDRGMAASIMATSASKLSGIQYVADLLGVELEEVMAFGDDYNDMEMIEACGVGVAMGNAVEELKQAADYVTKTNEEDGVAEFLQEYFQLYLD